VAHDGPSFFLLGWGGVGWGGVGFLFFALFPMCSHHVLTSSQVVLQDVHNCTSILSHMVCPKFNSHVYKLKR